MADPVNINKMLIFSCFILNAALNEALKEEIQHLKVLTGQAMPNGGPMLTFPASYGANQQYHPGNHAMHTMLTAQQLQQLQIHSQKQQHQLLQQQQLQHQQEQARDSKLRVSMLTHIQKDLSPDASSKD